MSPTVNGKVIFNSIPTGFPEPGKTTVYDESETIDLETVPLDGGVLLKTLDLQVDPYMRGRMRDASKPSYVPAFPLGQPLTGGGIAKVLRSEKEGVKAGDYYLGFFPHQHYNIVKDLTGFQKIEKKAEVPLSWYLGVLGMPGRTAFHAWNEYSQAKKGDTVYVSTGAGPVGSVVVQLAKSEGLKVIASAGDDDKVNFIKECGADVAFNYKKVDTKEVLQKEGPINVYWDNVGGYQLEAALEAAANGARFIECGMIDSYNKESYHVKNLFHIVTKGLHIHGFIVNRDLGAKWDAKFDEIMPKRVANGEFKVLEEVTKGLDKVGDVIKKVQEGKNKGRSIVAVAED